MFLVLLVGFRPKGLDSWAQRNAHVGAGVAVGQARHTAYVVRRGVPLGRHSTGCSPPSTQMGCRTRSASPPAER